MALYADPFAERGGYREIVGVGIDLVEGAPNFTLGALLPVFVGSPSSVTLRLEITTGVDTSGTDVFAQAEGDYGHSMRWRPITHVFDQDGTRIEAFTAISPETGFSYAVPEPSTYALLLAGLCVLAYRGRRRAQRSS